MKTHVPLTILMLLVIACRARREPHSDKGSEMLAAAGSGAAGAGAVASSLDSLVVSAGRPGVVTLGSVTVDRRPYCQANIVAVLPNPWLASQRMQQRVELLASELERFANAHVGTIFQNEPNVAIVILHQDFERFEELQQRLVKPIAPLNVQLRSACHSREELNRALQILEERSFHPKAKTTAMSWYLDASFAGYVVHVDEAEPNVAQSLRARLGTLGIVLAGKPSRRDVVLGTKGPR